MAGRKEMMDWALGELVNITVPDEEGEASGRRWVHQRVGMLKHLAHVRDFSNTQGDLTPEQDLNHFIVSVDHDKAKGEYALARVPIAWMRHHDCNGTCPEVHPCQVG